ncbi:chorismate mutase [Aliikangiella marina]|uniref:chorismate mutase n=1 Tax=Aliikangiella marina TaxID=1712262 RepID=A0A545TIU9_9GAMM|nr:chorismate mutase [Aliikangiella marina]TQV77154.1 chorismate mutase [Aliikangiella marina]
MKEPEANNTHSDLDELRKAIDRIDEKLINLLTQRSNCVEKIAEIKCHSKVSIYDSERENKILQAVTENNPTKYQSVDMANIFHAILRAGLNQQLLYRSEHIDD